MTFAHAPLSFDFADTLPSTSWEPPTMALLQVDDTPPDVQGVLADLALARVEHAWAPTERMTL